jgi:DNA sulfur modification protein DndE
MFDINIRYSQQVRNSLMTVKRRTKLQHFHTVCRWGLCISLADERPARSQKAETSADSAVYDLPWTRFGQEFSELLAELLKIRAVKEGIECTDTNLQKLAEAHITRGVRRLAANKDIRSIVDLVKLPLEEV